MKKLWQTSTKMDPTVEAFETKEDLLLDQKLIKYDCLASIAHAKTLKRVGVLSGSELNQIKAGLREIMKLSQKGQFKLELGDEDMHTKIENYLTLKLGSVGQKIQTGRSRNDQVLTAMRLYCKEELAQVKQELNNLIESFEKFSKKHGQINMPGYTHMQKAMPSSIQLWSGSFIESLQNDLVVLENALVINDQSPLGSAAGYGTSFPLDRSYSAKLLGFAKLLENPLYCQNSKGKIETVILAALIQILLTINKFASDVMLFTTAEFGFFEVGEAVTTGSSLMPQKRNVDLAELLRSKVHLVMGNFTQIVSLSSNLTSGYNRDLQDMKKPLIESVEVSLASIKAANILLNNLTPNKKTLEEGLTEEIFATEKTLRLVKKGMPFRKAYTKVKANK